MVAGSLGSGSWPVEPAQRVGPFTLGMGVNEALAVVQKMMGSLDRCGLFGFDETRIFETDLSLRLPSLGFQLCFDAYGQDLCVIAVWLQPDNEASSPDLSKADSSGALGRGIQATNIGAATGGHTATEPMLLQPLSYGGLTFAGVQQAALTFRDIYKMFGPTWVGDFHADGQAAYFLRYPGLAFEFPLPEDLVDELAARGEHPMELPGQPPPVARRMWIFAADSPSALPISARLEEPEAIVVRPAAGVELRGRLLRFGAMPQDVFSDFGPPEQVCIKDVDAVRIHSVSACLVSPRLPGPDYYYNYFQLGLDILFDGRKHIVKKVVLHTNPPTHELFSIYRRCFFQIPFYADEESQAAALDAALPELELPPAVDSSLHSGDADSVLLMGLEEALADDGYLQADVGLPGATGRRLQAEALHGMCPDSADEVPEEVTEEHAPASCEAAVDDATEDRGDTSLGTSTSPILGRMTKKERKAARKGKKNRQGGDARVPIGSPGSSPKGDTSPDLSLSPDPSPLLATLDAGASTASASSPGRPSRSGSAPAKDVDNSAFDSLDDVLPPPAMPLDESNAVAETSDLVMRGTILVVERLRKKGHFLIEVRYHGDERAQIVTDWNDLSVGQEVSIELHGAPSESGQRPKRKVAGEWSEGALLEVHPFRTPSSHDLGWLTESADPDEAAGGEFDDTQAAPAGALADSDASRSADPEATTCAVNAQLLAASPTPGSRECRAVPEVPQAELVNMNFATDNCSGSLPGVEGDCIDVRWPWPKIREILGKSAGCGCGKPLVVNKGSHTPFGSTYFYAFPGLVFEVMHNGYVASLTVFSVPPSELLPIFKPKGAATRHAAEVEASAR